jgi:hypothetical protein
MVCIILVLLSVFLLLGLLAGSLILACCLVKVNRPSFGRAIAIVLLTGLIQYLCCRFLEGAMAGQDLCCPASMALGFCVSSVVYAAFIPTTIFRAALVNLLVSILYGLSVYGLCLVFGGIAALA